MVRWHRHSKTFGLALLGALLACLSAGPAHPETAAPAPDSLFAHPAWPSAPADGRNAPLEAPWTQDLQTLDPETQDPATQDAWTRWFDALERSSSAPASPLFPLDGPAEPPRSATPYRHLAIAKAVTQRERAEEAAGGDAEARGAASSPLLALANARNYLHLSEYDQALSWYAHAGALDREGHFRRETGREALAAAICARDTVAAGRALAATMAAADLAGREAEFVLAMRWLLGRGDATTLSWFVDRASAPEFAADVRVAFWRAYSLSWLERRAEALAELDRLLALGGRESVLGPRERGWVLTAWTDLTLLRGDRLEAERRYRQLATSGTPALRDWGRLQAAALAFLGNRYGEAAAGFREICQAETKGAWTEHACAMADMAGRLERLLNEGERYGAAAHYGQ